MMAMHTEHARYVYNVGLEQRRMWHPFKKDQFKKLTYESQSAELTEARKEYDWLAAGSQVVQQSALEDLAQA
jgi:putative transposase